MSKIIQNIFNIIAIFSIALCLILGLSLKNEQSIISAQQDTIGQLTTINGNLLTIGKVQHSSISKINKITKDVSKLAAIKTVVAPTKIIVQKQTIIQPKETIVITKAKPVLIPSHKIHFKSNNPKNTPTPSPPPRKCLLWIPCVK